MVSNQWNEVMETSEAKKASKYSRKYVDFDWNIEIYIHQDGQKKLQTTHTYILSGSSNVLSRTVEQRQ